MYVKSMRRWVVPYLNKLEMKDKGSYERLLSQLLTSCAKTDLNPCRLVFEASKSHVSFFVLQFMIASLLSLWY